MTTLRKAARWLKRLFIKARTLFEQLEDEWEALPPPLRSVLLTWLANEFTLPHFATEDDLWRWARQQRDDVLKQAIVKAQSLI